MGGEMRAYVCAWRHGRRVRRRAPCRGKRGGRSGGWRGNGAGRLRGLPWGGARALGGRPGRTGVALRLAVRRPSMLGARYSGARSARVASRTLSALVAKPRREPHRRGSGSGLSPPRLGTEFHYPSSGSLSVS